MKGVKITNLDLVKSDYRGSIYEFRNRNSSHLLLVKRKKGTVSGKHYHTGKNKLKDPETIIILDGECEVILRGINSHEEFSHVYNTPVMIEIDPYIYHEVKAITDLILLDMNSIDDDDDTIHGFPINNES